MGSCLQHTVPSVDAENVNVNDENASILIENEVNMVRLSKKLSLTGQTKRAYLVSGYVREYSPNMFPIDIIQSCLIFYDDIYYWIIKDDDLVRFKGCGINESYPLGKFVYGDFKFKAKLYPNTNSWYSQFVLTLLSELNSIKCMIIYIEIYCQETQSHYKTTVKLNKMRPNKKRKVLETNKLFPIRFNDKNINKGLNFAVSVEILHCEYNNTLFIINDINMLNKVEYEWNVNYDILKFIKQKYNNWDDYNLQMVYDYDITIPYPSHFIFYSDEFDKLNKNWCIYIKPTSNEIGIVLLRWPSFISTIKARVMFKLSWTVQLGGAKKKQWSMQAIFDSDHQYKSEIPAGIKHVFRATISRSNILSYKIYCKVIVTEVLDDHGINRIDTLIDVPEWKEGEEYVDENINRERLEDTTELTENKDD